MGAWLRETGAFALAAMPRCHGGQQDRRLRDLSIAPRCGRIRAAFETNGMYQLTLVMEHRVPGG